MSKNSDSKEVWWSFDENISRTLVGKYIRIRAIGKDGYAKLNAVSNVYYVNKTEVEKIDFKPKWVIRNNKIYIDCEKLVLDTKHLDDYRVQTVLYKKNKAKIGTADVYFDKSMIDNNHLIDVSNMFAHLKLADISYATSTIQILNERRTGTIAESKPSEQLKVQAEVAKWNKETTKLSIGKVSEEETAKGVTAKFVIDFDKNFCQAEVMFWSWSLTF